MAEPGEAVGDERATLQSPLTLTIALTVAVAESPAPGSAASGSLSSEATVAPSGGAVVLVKAEVIGRLPAEGAGTGINGPQQNGESQTNHRHNQL